MALSVLPFLRPGPTRADWSNQELAEFYRVEAVLGRAGVQVETDRGVTDEGDPWFVFCREETGDVVIHLARYDGRYVVASPLVDGVIAGRDFRAIIEQLIAAHPLVLPQANDGKLRIHPSALLVALVMTFLFKAFSTDAMAAEDSSLLGDHAGGPADAPSLSHRVQDPIAGGLVGPGVAEDQRATAVDQRQAALYLMTIAMAVAMDAAPVNLNAGGMAGLSVLEHAGLELAGAVVPVSGLLAAADPDHGAVAQTARATEAAPAPLTAASDVAPAPQTFIRAPTTESSASGAAQTLSKAALPADPRFVDDRAGESPMAEQIGFIAPTGAMSANVQIAAKAQPESAHAAAQAAAQAAAEPTSPASGASTPSSSASSGSAAAAAGSGTTTSAAAAATSAGSGIPASGHEPASSDAALRIDAMIGGAGLKSAAIAPTDAHALSLLTLVDAHAPSVAKAGGLGAGAASVAADHNGSEVASGGGAATGKSAGDAGKAAIKNGSALSADAPLDGAGHASAIGEALPDALGHLTGGTPGSALVAVPANGGASSSALGLDVASAAPTISAAPTSAGSALSPTTAPVMPAPGAPEPVGASATISVMAPSGSGAPALTFEQLQKAVNWFVAATPDYKIVTGEHEFVLYDPDISATSQPSVHVWEFADGSSIAIVGSLPESVLA